MPKLSVNVISKGKYWKAFEEIPDEELSPNLLRYVARDNGYQEEIRQQRSDANAVESKPQMRRLSPRNYVKRANTFKRVDPYTVPGEQLYKRKLISFPPRYVRYGKIQV